MKAKGKIGRPTAEEGYKKQGVIVLTGETADMVRPPSPAKPKTEKDSPAKTQPYPKKSKKGGGA